MKAIDMCSVVERFGGTLVIGDVPLKCEAPFDIRVGLDYDQKVIYVREAALADGPSVLCPIMHEMGHVFASSVAPNDSKETDFLGWEYALAKTLGLARQFRACLETGYNISTDVVLELAPLEQVIKNEEKRSIVAWQIKSGFRAAFKFYELSHALQNKVLQYYYDKGTAAGLIVNGKPVGVR